MNGNYSYLLISWLICSTGFSFAQNVKTLTPSPEIHKSPKTDEGKVLTYNYSVQNPTNDTLFILPPEIDCSCTSIDYPDFILPQQKAVFTITFDTDKKWGLQVRNVQVLVGNSSETKQYIIPLRFRVKVKATKETKKLIRQQIKDDKKLK